MLTKFLEEVSKRVLDVVLKRPYGAALVAVTTILGVTFLLLQYFRSTPTALQILRDPIFYAVAASTITIGLTAALKQSGRVPRVIAIMALASISLGFIAGAWKLYRDTTPIFKIDLVFDETARLDPVLLTRFLTRSQQPHLHITMLDRQLVAPDDGHVMVFDKTLREATLRLRSPIEATHTILVTSKMLANADWGNLFYSARGNFGVISLRGVADLTNPDDQNLALRYLASMIPLASMHALANELQISLLPDRSPATEHGCLHDFSVNRLLLVEKLRRGPELCAAEVAAISAAFGSTLVAEYQQILLSSSR